MDTAGRQLRFRNRQVVPPVGQHTRNTRGNYREASYGVSHGGGQQVVFIIYHKVFNNQH